MWYLYWIILMQINGDPDYSCKCGGKNLIFKNVKREFQLKSEVLDHGFINTLSFDSIGVMRVYCLHETHFPSLNMEKYIPERIDSLESGINYYGIINDNPEYIWREDVKYGFPLSILYVVKRDNKQEFDKILNSIVISP